MKLKLAALVCLVVAPLAHAQTVLYSVVLSGPAEAPPNASTGTGSALVTLDYDLATLKLETSFSGLLGTVTAAHLHGPTAIAGSGTAGVMTMTPTFTGFPLGVSTGTYSQTFDLNLASSYNAAFITANGGTVATALTALTNAFQDGKAYLNIHTTSFPGGEIRGFATPVPEPSALLLGAAAGSLLTLRRRRSPAA